MVERLKPCEVAVATFGHLWQIVSLSPLVDGSKPLISPEFRLVVRMTVDRVFADQMISIDKI